MNRLANNNAPAAHASMLSAVFFIGSAVVVGKWSVQAMPVFLSQAAALAAALLILVPLALFKYKKEIRVGRRDLLLLLLQALLGMFLYRVFMLYGLKHAAATDSAIVTSLTPAAVALLSRVLLRERLVSRLAAGVLCSLSGAMTVQVLPLIQHGAPAARSTIGGLLLVLLAVLGEAALTVIRKLQGDRVPPLLGTTYVCLIAFVLFLVPACAELSAGGMPVLGPRELAAVLYYGWFVTAIAYLLYFRGVTLLPSATVAAYTAVVPVSALLLSSLLLGERLTWPLLAGSVLVVAGMLLIAGYRGRARPTRAAFEASPPCACPPAKEAAPSEEPA